jgi:hypothetical protein
LLGISELLEGSHRLDRLRHFGEGGHALSMSVRKVGLAAI